MKNSLILKQMQMAYMAATLKETDKDACIYCWKNNCGCGAKTSVKEDSFINFTGEEMHNI
jgi:hypothetical protein